MPLDASEYSSIVEQSPLMIWRCDTAAQCNYFNDRWLVFTGRTSEEERGDGWTAGVHPDDLKRVMDIFLTAFREQRPFEMEYRLRRHDGVYRWIYDNGTPYTLASGKFAGYIGSCIDVTDRVSALQKATDAEKRYRALFDQATDYFMVIDPNGDNGPVIFDVNEAACNLHGYTRDEFIGLPLRALDNRESAEKAPERMKRVMAGEHLIFEVVHLRKDGTMFPVEVSAKKVELSGKTYVFSVERDISERKKATESLKKSEAFISSILQSVNEGFVVVDPEYRILMANRSFAESLDIQIDQAVGRFCYEVSHNVIIPCFEAGEDCPTRRTFMTGEPATAVHCHRSSSGEERFVEVRSYPMKDDSGKVMSVIEVIDDITEKRNLEAQLRNAQKMEAVGQLAGGIAHDFNNILTAIMGYANLLQMKMTEDDPFRSKVDEIDAAAQRAARLTASLLAYSRRQLLSPRPVDLNSIIKNIKTLLLRLLNEEIELKIVLAERELMVEADPGQIDQVLMNLATNARDAMPEGGTLIVRTSLEELQEDFIIMHGYGIPGLYAHISIADSGEGIDEKIRERIFDPFFTTKEVGKGTGLGLAMVYGIIRQHDGFIDMSSEVGKGTVFHIYLPIIKKGNVFELTSENLTAPRGSELILLAEDDSMITKLTIEILTTHGYRVITAEDGEEAVNKFRENAGQIDMLLLDVMMPKKNGKAAFDEIRKISPEIPALFISGYPAEVIRSRGLLEEGAHFVYKPISVRELLTKIRDVLDA